jgi:acyl-[acyl-carrier-protein] desaturase
VNEQEILHAITPDVEQLLERHLGTTKEWFPHEYVPYSRGRDHMEGHQWTPEDADLAGAQLSEEVRSALLVNLLTEDNLPYYFRSVERMFGKDGAWGEWARRWTAEEGRHSMAIYGYITVTRAIDPIELERSRMVQVSKGETPDPETTHEGFIYLALQELATRISHRNTGAQLGDDVGFNLLKRVCGDENLHQLFYRDLATAAIKADPNTMMVAMEKQVRSFAMPGTGIPDFERHAKAIARAGIYDLQIHHEQILAPVVLRQWDAANIAGLSGEGAAAQERLMKRMATSARVAKRYAEKRDAQMQPA